MFFLRFIAYITIVILLFTCKSYAGEFKFSQKRLLEKYAPVWVHEIGRLPIYDIITAWDFDNNFSGADNVENAEKFPLPAVVYGFVTAETSDAYYLFYGVYHVRDYDTPLREFFWSSSSHDNDFEGAMVVVAKSNGDILAIETWYHSIFLQFTYKPKVPGNQAIDGAIHVEDKTHPILYVSSKGHGVRGFQKIDEPELLKNQYKIYRLGKADADMRYHKGEFAQYELHTFEPFLIYGRGPFEVDSMFCIQGDYGLDDVPIGKYLSGRFAGDSSWARPKPPWSWTDKFDNLRPGAWFFHPAYVFNLYFGLGLSDRYIKNDAVEYFFNIDYAKLNNWILEEREDSFFPKAPKGLLSKPYLKVKNWLFKLIEPLFFYIG